MRTKRKTHEITINIPAKPEGLFPPDNIDWYIDAFKEAAEASERCARLDYEQARGRRVDNIDGRDAAFIQNDFERAAVELCRLLFVDSEVSFRLDGKRFL